MTNDAFVYSPDTQRLLLQWPPGVVEITGPKTLDFYRDFAKGKGNVDQDRRGGYSFSDVTHKAKSRVKPR
jgi:hypothetical protein